MTNGQPGLNQVSSSSQCFTGWQAAQGEAEGLQQCPTGNPEETKSIKIHSPGAKIHLELLEAARGGEELRENSKGLAHSLWMAVKDGSPRCTRRRKLDAGAEPEEAPPARRLRTAPPLNADGQARGQGSQRWPEAQQANPGQPGRGARTAPAPRRRAHQDPGRDRRGPRRRRRCAPTRMTDSWRAWPNRTTAMKHRMKEQCGDSPRPPGLLGCRALASGASGDVAADLAESRGCSLAKNDRGDEETRRSRTRRRMATRCRAGRAVVRSCGGVSAAAPAAVDAAG